MSRLRLRCLASLAIVLGSVGVAAAAPISWTYEGAVSVDFFGVMPVGTPVTFVVTADPAQNLLAGSPMYPDFMGAYLTTVSASMAGVNYSVSGSIEVNGDPVFISPSPGITNFREFSETTDHGFFYSSGFPVPTIAYVFEGNTGDPASPALLMPFSTFRLNLFVAPVVAGGIPTPVTVSGQLVPEPFSGVLLAVGFGLAAAAGARRCHSCRSATIGSVAAAPRAGT